MILDIPKDLTWAKEKAWVPAIASKNNTYYFYFVAEGNIGVGVSTKPTGPFKDALRKPLVKKGMYPGQTIDLWCLWMMTAQLISILDKVAVTWSS